jgi:hypothetical protein
LGVACRDGWQVAPRKSRRYFSSFALKHIAKREIGPAIPTTAYSSPAPTVHPGINPSIDATPPFLAVSSIQRSLLARDADDNSDNSE